MQPQSASQPAVSSVASGSAGSQASTTAAVAVAPAAAGAPAKPSEGTGTGAGATLPCEVTHVLQEHCTSCHDTMPKFTAPMPLVTWDDLMAPSKSMPSTPVYKLVMDRIKNVQRPMPPQPMAALSADEIAKLETWVSGGMPKGSGPACAPAAAAQTGAAGSGSAGATGAAAVDDLAADPDVQCYKFTANNGSMGKYAVPATPDLYQCFYFDAPWGNDKVQAVGANFIVDNASAVHHYILYTTSSGTPNTSAACPSGAHPDGQFVVGWAPGANPVRMPKDVGLELPGPKYLLETHYNAPSAGLSDASGIELCVTRKLRSQTAATHPLGAEGFNTTGPADVTGTCKPKGPFPVHVLLSVPHMHLKGTQLKTIIHRANGQTDTLIDKPFDFMNQLAYETPVTINEGDTLETTCTYNTSAQFGTGTNQEMCYNFVTAYPAGALAGVPGYTGLSNNGNICVNGLFGL